MNPHGRMGTKAATRNGKAKAIGKAKANAKEKRVKEQKERGNTGTGAMDSHGKPTASSNIRNPGRSSLHMPRHQPLAGNNRVKSRSSAGSSPRALANMLLPEQNALSSMERHDKRRTSLQGTGSQGKTRPEKPTTKV